MALVTGANKGIGKEIARGLASHGFQVLLCARDERLGETAVKELQASGCVSVLRLDVCDPLSIASAALHVQERFGRVDVLVRSLYSLSQYARPEARGLHAWQQGRAA